MVVVAKGVWSKIMHLLCLCSTLCGGEFLSSSCWHNYVRFRPHLAMSALYIMYLHCTCEHHSSLDEWLVLLPQEEEVQVMILYPLPFKTRHGSSVLLGHIDCFDCPRFSSLIHILEPRNIGTYVIIIWPFPPSSTNPQIVYMLVYKSDPDVHLNIVFFSLRQSDLCSFPLKRSPPSI